MMLYYQTKFGCKRPSSVEKSYFDHISPRCDLDIEDSQPISLHDTPPRDNIPSYQVWYKKNIIKKKKKRLSGTGDTMRTIRHTDRMTDRQAHTRTE